MKQLQIIFSTLCTVMLLTGCTFTQTHINRESDKNKATEVVSKFYQYVKIKDYGRANNLFNKETTNKAQKDNEFRAYADRLDKYLGPINNIKLIECNTKVIEGSNNVGEYNLVYHVIRGNTLCKDTFKIILHNGEIKGYNYNVMSANPNFRKIHTPTAVNHIPGTKL